MKNGFKIAEHFKENKKNILKESIPGYKGVESEVIVCEKLGWSGFNPRE